MKVLISIFLFVTSVGSLLSLSQDRNQTIKPALALSIRSAQSSYSIKENIRLEIQVENVSKDSLLIWRSWGWGVGRTNVRVFDRDGKEVFTDFLADQIPPPPRSSDFIEVKPHEFFGIELDESATHFVRTPGTYDIFVEYTSSLPEKFIRDSLQLPNLPIWAREQGTIVSNRIRIVVSKN
jgi:hypothetical protein